MSDPIKFSIVVSPTVYGDDRTFCDYKIKMWLKGKVVGCEDGPRRCTQRRSVAVDLAQKRVAQLKTHRLFAVFVTNKCIVDGDARDCDTCAISQALWHRQQEIGLPKDEYSFRVTPYACFADADGITLWRSYTEPEKLIPHNLWPDILTPYGNKFYTQSLVDWTQNWDDWAESRSMLLSDWRKRHGHTDGETPSKPSPCSFVLDLDSFVPLPT